MDGLSNDGGAGDETGDGGTPDDLYVLVRVAEDERFLRDGNDTLRAKDGVADTEVNCGPGTDVAEADPSDPVITSGTDDCETVKF
jgi:DnaJ-class molecular chaperone